MNILTNSRTDGVMNDLHTRLHKACRQMASGLLTPRDFAWDIFDIGEAFDLPEPTNGDDLFDLLVHVAGMALARYDSRDDLVVSASALYAHTVRLLELGDQHATTVAVVEQALASYITFALWLTTDDDGALLDNRLLSPQARQQMRADVTAFVTDLPPKTTERLTADQIGDDFWLTRNHHGAGFWDRGLGELGDVLTNKAHAFGEVNLYLGDDGLIYQG